MSWLALYCVDPGGTSGVARGIVEVNGALGAPAVVERGLERGAVETWEVDGSPLEQAVEIAGEFLDWYYWALNEDGRCGADRINLVVESFQLRKRNVDLTPLYMIGAIQGLLWKWFVGDGVVPAGWYEEQTAGQAKGYATDERLRRWGLWVVGSAHRRDAMKHFVYRVHKLMD